jgi:hypothetical protein
MFTEDDYHYALENTRVILAPERRIQTFGNTSFRFHLVTELMDSVNQVRVRDGRIHAEKPQIFTPSHLSRILLDGFGDKAREFADWIEQHAADRAFLKYGFQFRKSDVVERVVHQPLDRVVNEVRRTVEREEDPLAAIIHGVDDAWEVCLLKFAVDMIQQSADGNIGDFRRRGLL